MEPFTPHYTPKHGSWLNQAEIEIGPFSRRCPGHRRIPTLNHLEREADAWNESMNRHRVLIEWRFTRAKARRKFRYKRHRIMRSEHQYYCVTRLEAPQKGQGQIWRSRDRARRMRRVAMECGLCRSGRMRAAGLEVSRQLGGW